MSTQLCQRLLSISVAAMLAGCSTIQPKSDLLSSLIADGGTTGAQAMPAVQAAALQAGSTRVVNDSFSFHAFGDSGWAGSHRPKPTYEGGFQRAYALFDHNRSLLGDINYINWETTAGTICDAFWSPPTNSAYAYLTRPEELTDAIRLGFNLVGLANNHTYDCLRSPEGAGPLQSHGQIEKIRRQFAESKQGPTPVFSGVYAQPNQAIGKGVIRSRDGLEIAVTFLSASMGGDPRHCRNMGCKRGLERNESNFRSQRGLRALALHSWDPGSHARLKAVLRRWLQRGLVDVAIGSGPHIAEDVSVVNRNQGPGVLATRMGNIIHPSLSRQPYNIAPLTRWRLDPDGGRVNLLRASRIIISCDGETCRMGATRTLWSEAQP